MRLTKERIKEAKRVIHRRVKELANMDDEELVREFTRCFPARDRSQTPAFVNGIRMELMQDSIDRALPDHWLD